MPGCPGSATTVRFGASERSVAAQVLGSGTPKSVTVAFTIVRALDFLLLLLVGGGTLMLVVGLKRAPAEARSKLSRLPRSYI